MEAHFQGLGPQQIDTWSTTDVTAVEKAVGLAPEKDPEIQEALTLFKGVELAIPKEIELNHSEFPNLSWNEKSQNALRKKYESLVNELRSTEKGSKAHIQKVQEIVGVRPILAAVELVTALRSAFADGLPNRATLTGSIAALAQASIGSIRKLGGISSSQALMEALGSLPSPSKARPTQSATYVQDEDSLAAFLDSFGSSCLDPTGNHKNRAALVEPMVSGQYKLSRIYQDGQPAFRGFVRLYRGKMANYDGHVLFGDRPVGVENWNTTAPAPLAKLHYKHVIDKAKRMGIPAVFRNDAAKNAAEEMGAKFMPQQITLLVSKGETGIHHVQGMDLKPYIVQWQPVDSRYQGPKPEANAPFAELSENMFVVMP